MVEVKISTLAFALLVVTSVYLGMSALTSDLGKNYATKYGELESIVFNTNITTTMQDARSTSENPYEGVEGEETINLFYQAQTGSWDALTAAGKVNPLATNVINETARYMHFPDWAYTMMITSISMIVTFAIISTIVKREV